MHNNFISKTYATNEGDNFIRFYFEFDFRLGMWIRFVQDFKNGKMIMYVV